MLVHVYRSNSYISTIKVIDSDILFKLVHTV